MLAMALIFGIFGLIVGSFLNVVILRYGTGGGLGGRSACMSCGMQLHSYHLIPVFSWLALRGRCSGCGTRISIQYPLVEAVTAIVFATVGSTLLPLLPQLLALLAFSFLIALSAYDLKHTIIPDQWSYAFAAFSLAFSIATLMPHGFSDWGMLIASGPAVALPIWALWFVSKGRAMGFGDVKLAVGIGWLLGPYWGIVTLFLGFIIGAIISVCILLPLPYLRRAFALHRFSLGEHSEGFTMKSEVPFGPFLACSCFLIWYAHFALALAPLVLY
jgi:prepilin signal peptidase PulO-like enzyme (type II secretory pathway)